MAKSKLYISTKKDRYWDIYAQYNKWSKEDVFFVTREKDNAKSIVLLERDLPNDKDFEILLDEHIVNRYLSGVKFYPYQTL